MRVRVWVNNFVSKKQSWLRREMLRDFEMAELEPKIRKSRAISHESKSNARTSNRLQIYNDSRQKHTTTNSSSIVKRFDRKVGRLF